MTTNYEVALNAERKRVIRCFQHYSTEQRANLQASHRQGHRQRHATGKYFYVHPDVPGLGFPSRKSAAEAALTREAQA